MILDSCGSAYICKHICRYHTAFPEGPPDFTRTVAPCTSVVCHVTACCNVALWPVSIGCPAHSLPFLRRLPERAWQPCAPPPRLAPADLTAPSERHLPTRRAHTMAAPPSPDASSLHGLTSSPELTRLCQPQCLPALKCSRTAPAHQVGLQAAVQACGSWVRAGSAQKCLSEHRWLPPG